MEEKEKPIKDENSEVIKYIYTPYITRNGVRIYAKQYGKKVFKIPKNK